MDNTIQPKTTLDNIKSRRGIVEKHPKTHVNYWRPRLRRQRYGSKAAGTYRELSALTVRINYLGRSHSFTFQTLNETVAATKARDLYREIYKEGWDAVLTRNRPAEDLRKENPTVGQFLAEVEAKSGLRPRTLRNYTNSIRTIIAGIYGLDTSNDRFDYRGGGSARWRAKIDSKPLADITPAKVQKWKVAFLKAVGDSPAAIQSAKRTVNSYIRCSRSLFSPKLLKFLALTLSAPLPFTGVELEKTGSMRYVSKINAETLIAAARLELKVQSPEAYKIFLLGLFAGLRRAEIDGLEWTAIDWTQSVINVVNTPVLHVKADGSAATVEVDAEVIAELKAFLSKSKSSFVIHSHLAPRPGHDRAYYRCEHHFKRLTNWLRSKGITANKPLHELRKELGALVATEHGIYAAAHILRHSDIATTAKHYADQKKRVSVNLGKYLSNAEIKIVPPPPKSATSTKPDAIEETDPGTSANHDGTATGS